MYNGRNLQHGDKGQRNEGGCGVVRQRGGHFGEEHAGDHERVGHLHRSCEGFWDSGVR